jgi:hypothetical protein
MPHLDAVSRGAVSCLADAAGRRAGSNELTNHALKDK